MLQARSGDLADEGGYLPFPGREHRETVRVSGGGDTHHESSELVRIDEPLRVSMAHSEDELVKARVESEGVGERFERDGVRSGERTWAFQVREHCRELVEISHPRDGEEDLRGVEVLDSASLDEAQRR